LDASIFYAEHKTVSANALKNGMDVAGLYEGSVVTFSVDGVTTVEVEVFTISTSFQYSDQFCPANSDGIGGTGEGVSCVCIDGFTGDIAWVSTGDVREYRGECVTDGTGAVVAGVLASATAAVASTAGAASITSAATATAVELSSMATSAASTVSGSGGTALQGISSTTQGAASSVLAQLQLLALLSKVPAVYQRAPTFASTYRSSGWLNLQSIPGWWTSGNNSNSSTNSQNYSQGTTLPGYTTSTPGDMTTTPSTFSRRHRRLATAAETTTASSGNVSCDLNSLSSDASSIVPDEYADFMSSWFYTLVLIFFLVLGQAVAFWVLSNCRPRVMESLNAEVVSEMDNCQTFLKKLQPIHKNSLAALLPSSPRSKAVELVEIAIDESSDQKEVAANGPREDGADNDADNDSQPPKCLCLVKLLNQVCN